MPQTEAIAPAFAAIFVRLTRLYPGVHFCCHPILAVGHRLEIRVSEADDTPPEHLTRIVFEAVTRALRDASAP